MISKYNSNTSEEKNNFHENRIMKIRKLSKKKAIDNWRDKMLLDRNQHMSLL